MFQTELENLHKYRSSAVYPAEVSSRAVLVVSLLSQCAWLVSFFLSRLL